MYTSWTELRTHCLACQKCTLCETRTQVVFGVGNEQAKVMLIGEGPGENEDLQGEPFVGRGGALLDKLLAAVDLDRKKNIYGKKTCWDIKGCMGKAGKGKDCVAYQYPNYPCWNALGTLCKGETGRDVRACLACEVYKKYGNGAPVLVFDVASIK